MAAALSGTAAALLPRPYRVRYAEEWTGKLADLAAAGAGQWRQLIHSARLLATAGPMRAVLMVAARHRQAG